MTRDHWPTKVHQPTMTAVSLNSPVIATTLIRARAARDAIRADPCSTRTRVESRPDVPTIHESGFDGFESNEWAGFFGPAGTPPAVVQALYESLAEAVGDPAIRQRLVQIGCVPLATRPEEFARFVRDGRVEMATLVREANIRAE